MSKTTKILLCLLTAAFCSAAPSLRHPAYAQTCQQTERLVADNPSQHKFGTSVSLSGDRIAIGAPFDQGAAGGDGAVFEFKLEPAGWEQKHKHTVADLLGHLGFAVSIDADAIVAGGRTGTFDRTGSAYRIDSNNPQPEPLIPNPARGQLIGYAVAVEGDVTVVTAPGTSSSAGMAYVIDPSGGQLVDRLSHPNPTSGGRFGHAAAIDDDTLAISALAESRDGHSYTGSVVVFGPRQNGFGWQVTDELTSPGPQSDDRFGYSVAVSDDTLAVGAPYTDTPANQAGMVYVFEPSGAIHSLTASDGDINHQFGYSVAVSGDILVAGAPNALDDSGRASGAAYLFKRIGGSWQQICKIFAGDGGLVGGFGTSVSIKDSPLPSTSTKTFVIGAPLELLPNPAIGAAYVFELIPDDDDHDEPLP